MRGSIVLACIIGISCAERLPPSAVVARVHLCELAREEGLHIVRGSPISIGTMQKSTFDGIGGEHEMTPVTLIVEEPIKSSLRAYQVVSVLVMGPIDRNGRSILGSLKDSGDRFPSAIFSFSTNRGQFVARNGGYFAPSAAGFSNRLVWAGQIGRFEKPISDISVGQLRQEISEMSQPTYPCVPELVLGSARISYGDAGVADGQLDAGE